MKTTDINIRDPFVLVHEGKYYLYGTRGATCWGEADGFDCYVSDDMLEWSEAIEVFHKPEGFWSDRNYWAPEVHYYKGKFYMFASFYSEARNRGTQILVADKPLGPFKLHSDGPVTPEEWMCLDGTLYVDKKGVPYIVFCHEWVQIGDGTICALQLNDDLSAPIGKPRQLFAASEAIGWVRKLENKKRTDDCYVTDGPFMYRCDNGELLMIWSSFGEGGYTEAIARSDNGDIDGNWIQDKVPLFEKDGGHGMLFKTLEGKLMLALHSPNKTLLERPVFYLINEKDGQLKNSF